MGRSTLEEKCFRQIAYGRLPSQERFHQSGARFKGFSGPVGSGKSQALCQEAIKLTYVNPGRMGLIGAPTYPMLRDATQATFFEILGKNRIPYEHNKAENVVLMTDTRSRIVFRAVDDFDRLRGTNLAWFGIDELTYCPEEAWLRLEARLRDPDAVKLCGFGVWTPKGYDWVYRRFIASPVSGYEVILAQPNENRYLLEKTPDFYERLRLSYDERFYQQEVLGAYLNVNAGQVYQAFDRTTNVTCLGVDPARPLLWALDFNVDPMSSVIAQTSNGVVRVLDEIVLSRASTVEACEEFMSRYPNHPGGLVLYGDASGSRMQTAGTSDYTMIQEFFRNTVYRRYSLRVPKANPTVRDRIVVMNARLRTAAGECRMLVDPRCTELIKDLEEVSYLPNSTAIDKNKDAKRTHLSDALGYLVWQETRLNTKFGPQGERLF